MHISIKNMKKIFSILGIASILLVGAVPAFAETYNGPFGCGSEYLVRTKEYGNHCSFTLGEKLTVYQFKIVSGYSTTTPSLAVYNTDNCTGSPVQTFPITNYQIKFINYSQSGQPFCMDIINSSDINMEAYAIIHTDVVPSFTMANISMTANGLGAQVTSLFGGVWVLVAIAIAIPLTFVLIRYIKGILKPNTKVKYLYPRL